MLSIKRMDRLLEKMSRGEAWSFPAKIPRDDDTISVYSVDVADRGVCSNEMTTLIPSSGILLNLTDTAPPPCKDYCQIVVTLNDVTFRLWKISLRNNIKVAPIEMKNSYEDFPYDDRARSEILRVFGRKTYDYVLNLVQGQIDYFPRLPRDLLLKIVQKLELEDITKLAIVSKQFREICNSEELWEQLFLQHTESANVTEQLYALARELGWKKLFFTNKLQLQVQLRRQAQRMQDLHIPFEHGDAPVMAQDPDEPQPSTASQYRESKSENLEPPKSENHEPPKLENHEPPKSENHEPPKLENHEPLNSGNHEPPPESSTSEDKRDRETPPKDESTSTLFLTEENQ